MGDKKKIGASVGRKENRQAKNDGDPWENLANAIIAQAFDDWCDDHDGKLSRTRVQEKGFNFQISSEECEKFFDSNWCSLISPVDPQIIKKNLYKILYHRREERKRKRREKFRKRERKYFGDTHRWRCVSKTENEYIFEAVSDSKDEAPKMGSESKHQPRTAKKRVKHRTESLPVYCVELEMTFPSINAAANYIHTVPNAIVQALNSKSHQTHGMRFFRLEEWNNE